MRKKTYCKESGEFPFSTGEVLIDQLGALQQMRRASYVTREREKE